MPSSTRRRCSVLAILATIFLPMTGRSASDAPVDTTGAVPVIFDTDMDTDCDDAGALAILHALADRGEAVILATPVSSRLEGPVPCTEVINGYYGRSDLPVGVPRSVDTGRDKRDTPYARQIGAMRPVRHKTVADAPDAVVVYRRALAAAEDRSVVLVSVGDLTNMRDLLASPADGLSPLPGRDLAARKIRLWVCMGGRYPKHLDPGVFGNFKPDADSTVKAVRDWPGPILFTGLGDDILTGGTLKSTPADNPVRRAYEIYLKKTPTRPSWDPIAVLYAVRPGLPWWTVRTGGYNHIFENGTNEWREGPEGNHRLLELKPGAEKALRDMLDELMTVRPARPGP